MSIKLNLGCGKDHKEGWVNVDKYDFTGSDVTGLLGIVLCDLGKDVWPWDDDSCEEAFCSHMIGHLTASERIHFINELHRVLQKDRGCQIIAPHWASCRAYGDLTHQWPPVSEFWFYYLNKKWRVENAPHSTYNDDVNFECTWGYRLKGEIQVRNPEYQQYAMNYLKEAVEDIYATVIKTGE